MLFLHWYHHLTVLLYCWHSYAAEAPHALYFVAMNYGVHSIMYTYYALMALHLKPSWFAPEVVTAAQILQVIVGVSVQVAAMRSNCGVDRNNLIAGGVMYFTYLLLFVKFAVDRFVTKRFRRSEVVAAVAGQAPSQDPLAEAFPWLAAVFRKMKKVVSQPKLAV